MFKTIRAKFITVYLLYALVFIVIIGILYSREKTKLFNRAVNEYRQRAQINANIISSEIKENSLLLKNTGARIYTEHLDKKAILTELKRLLGTNKKIYINAAFIDKNEIMLDSYGKEYDVSQHNIFESFDKNNGTQIVLNSYIENREDKPLIMLGELITGENNEVKGILSVSIDVKELLEKIKGNKFLDNAYSWIIDKNGVIISHPNKDYINQDIGVQRSEELGFVNFSDVAKEILTTDNGVVKYYNKKLNEKKIMIFSLIPNTPDWKLCITNKEKEIFKEINSIVTNLLLTGFAILAVFLVLVIKKVDSVSTPIKKLTEAVENSINKNFEPLNLDLYSDNEVGHLILAYNEMITAITVHTETLEELVAERTRELDKLNQKLAEKNEMLSEENENLFDKAAKDILTGLFNREQLSKQLENICEKMKNGNLIECTIFFLDLDNFKYYNDTFGHDVGDKILKTIADDFRIRLRENDFIARYGGDEFVIVLPGVSSENAEIVKEALEYEIEKFHGFEEYFFEWTGVEEMKIQEEKKLGVSIGIYNFKEESIQSVDKLLKYADRKMYVEKKKRKKRRNSK